MTHATAGKPPPPGGGSSRFWLRLRTPLFLVLLMAPFVGSALLLINASGPLEFQGMLEWFDPLFFQYNLLLYLLFVLIVPVMTAFYVDSMKEERLVRLQDELSSALWEAKQEEIQHKIERQFNMRNYVGSTLMLMLVISISIGVILLLKPTVDPEAQTGIDYQQGANLFLTGAFIEAYPGDMEKFYHRVVISLTAFQFGFLGAYVFFLGHLIRGYFTLDLTPNTFVTIAVRMITASLLALVLSFVLAELPFFKQGAGGHKDSFLSFLPVLSFFIGFFPSRGILLLSKLSSAALQVFRAEEYNATPLGKLEGMSYEHEVRLTREGFDNAENLAKADPIALAVRTGFSYAQLRDWVGQARLMVQLDPDYQQFRDASGLRTVDDLVEHLEGAGEEAGALLERTVGPELAAKLEIVGDLLRQRSLEARQGETGASSAAFEAPLGG